MLIMQRGCHLTVMRTARDHLVFNATLAGLVITVS
jgi:hypothetical protein